MMMTEILTYRYSLVSVVWLLRTRNICCNFYFKVCDTLLYLFPLTSHPDTNTRAQLTSKISSPCFHHTYLFISSLSAFHTALYAPPSIPSLNPLLTPHSPSLPVPSPGAALAGVRVIVQAGWSEISGEDFTTLALEAEKQARLAGLAEEEEEDEEEDSNSDINRVRKEQDELRNKTNSETLDPQSGMKRNTDTTPDTPNRSDPPNNTSTNTGTSTLPPKALPPKRAPWSAHRDSLLIGSCPHSWLFGQVGAVVHHGGAGRDTILSLSLLFPPLSLPPTLCLSLPVSLSLNLSLSLSLSLSLYPSLPPLHARPHIDMSEHKHRLTHTPSPLPNTNTSQALPYCTLHTHSLTLSLSLTHKHSPSSTHAHTQAPRQLVSVLANLLGSAHFSVISFSGGR